MLECRRGLCWNFMCRGLRHFESTCTWSGCEVNGLTDGCFGERPPAVGLSHADLARSEERHVGHPSCEKTYFKLDRFNAGESLMQHH